MNTSYYLSNPQTDRLADVREETLRYSQLATAQENLKHLFTVPETVVKTETEIEEGNLLDAHKALSELEQARDDLVCKIFFYQKEIILIIFKIH